MELERRIPVLKCKRKVRDFGQELSGCLQIVLPLPWDGSLQELWYLAYSCGEAARSPPQNESCH